MNNAPKPPTSARFAKPLDEIVGELIDERYELVSSIDLGGMACVYRARDNRLERDVAIKLMHPHLAHNDKLVARFEREAKSAANLFHPHIVQVFDQGIWQGRPYLVLEFVNGPNLRSRLEERGTFTVGQALDYIRQVLLALQGAHTRQLLHRDIKPENVLVGPGEVVKVADFGLAHAISQATGNTTGSVMGTVAYLAPELITGEPSDAHADIYSVGIMLYELLVGRSPYTSESAIQTAWEHVNKDVPDLPADQAPGFPTELNGLIKLFSARVSAARPFDATSALAALDETREKLTPPQLEYRYLPRSGSGAEENHTQVLAGLEISSSPREIALPEVGAQAPVSWQQKPSFTEGLRRDDVPAETSVPQELGRATSAITETSRGAARGGQGEALHETTVMATLGAGAVEPALPGMETPEKISLAPAQAAAGRAPGAEGEPAGRASRWAGWAKVRAKFSPEAAEANVQEDTALAREEAPAASREHSETVGAAKTTKTPKTIAPGETSAHKAEPTRGEGTGAAAAVSKAATARVQGPDGANHGDAKADASAPSAKQAAAPAAPAHRPAVQAPAPASRASALPTPPARAAASSGPSAPRRPLPAGVSYPPAAQAKVKLERAEQGGPVSRRRRLWGWILALILLVAAFAGGTTWWFVWGPGSRVEVPQVAGLSAQAAQKTVEARDLVPTVDEDFSDTIPAGQVIGSQPTAGVKLYPQSKVKVLVSKGVKMVDVPELAGLDKDAALARLQEADLLSGALGEAYSNDVPEGKVISSAPEAGANVKHGTEVQLTISLGREPTRVPSVSGLSVDAAKAALAQAGLEVRVVEQFDDNVARGQVMSQATAAGQSVFKGDTVVITVSKGPEFITLPDVSGMRMSEAKARLEGMGMKVRTRSLLLGVNPNSVYSMSPSPGTRMRVGETVTLNYV